VEFSSTDETDPDFPRLENTKHVIEVSHLKALEVSVEEDEWRVHLASERKMEGSNNGKLVSAAAVDGSAEEEDSPSRAAEAAFSNKRRKKTMQLLKRARRKALLERERAAAGATSGCSRPLDWSDYDSWSKPSSEDGGGVDLSCWHDRHHMYEDLGYGATVTSVIQELHRYWAARAHSATIFSSGARRAARRKKRLARREQRLQEGETYYLAIERDLPKPEEKCAASGGVEAVAETPAVKTWSSDVEKKMEATLSLHASASGQDEAMTSGVSHLSTNVSSDFYSAIDTGTTLTIMDLADGTRLDGFDPEASVKIMGFNGSVLRSRGQGTAVGFGIARDGRRVILCVPKVHNLPGAPNDLLSVSAMVALGYEFHYRHAGDGCY